MRIGIDYRPALTSGSGIGRYVAGLVRGLARIAAADGALRLDLYGYHLKRVPHHIVPPRGGAVRLRRGPVPARLVHALGRLGYGIEFHFGRPALFHFTDFTHLPLRGTPHVFTLHDVSFLVEPRWHEPRAAAALVRVLDRLRAGARRIFVHSEHAAAEAVRVLGIERERILVTRPGVEERFFAASAEAVAGARARHALRDPYVLCVGTLEPRKNLLRLVEAFARVARRRSRLHLVLAGARGWLDTPVLEAVERSAFRERIRLLGRVADDDLPGLYAGAAAAAYVSLYEGFGLPVLEALAAGVPTVASNAASVPEAAGEAAVLVDPHDPAAIAAGLERVLDDAALGERLRAAGPAHARGFTWLETARATLAGYREALA